MIVGQETPASDIPPFDALVLLGRGIDEHETLSATSHHRAVVAKHLIEIMEPRVAVFTGGRSWRQVAEGIEPPSEGFAMFDTYI